MSFIFTLYEMLVPATAWAILIWLILTALITGLRPLRKRGFNLLSWVALGAAASFAMPIFNNYSLPERIGWVIWQVLFLAACPVVIAVLAIWGKSRSTLTMLVMFAMLYMLYRFLEIISILILFAGEKRANWSYYRSFPSWAFCLLTGFLLLTAFICSRKPAEENAAK